MPRFPRKREEKVERRAQESGERRSEFSSALLSPFSSLLLYCRDAAMGAGHEDSKRVSTEHVAMNWTGQENREERGDRRRVEKGGANSLRLSSLLSPLSRSIAAERQWRRPRRLKTGLGIRRGVFVGTHRDRRRICSHRRSHLVRRQLDDDLRRHKIFERVAKPKANVSATKQQFSAALAARAVTSI